MERSGFSLDSSVGRGAASVALRQAPTTFTCASRTGSAGATRRRTRTTSRWLAVDRGRLRCEQGERVHWGQIAAFGDWRGVIEMQADGETSFVLGSARRYPIRSCWASTRPSRPDAARAGGSFLRPRDRSDLVGARRPVIMCDRANRLTHPHGMAMRAWAMGLWRVHPRIVAGSSGCSLERT